MGVGGGWVEVLRSVEVAEHCQGRPPTSHTRQGPLAWTASSSLHPKNPHLLLTSGSGYGFAGCFISLAQHPSPLFC